MLPIMTGFDILEYGVYKAECSLKGYIGLWLE